MMLHAGWRCWRHRSRLSTQRSSARAYSRSLRSLSVLVSLLLLLLLLGLGLGACSSPPPPLPPLASLRLPGVVQLNEVAALETKTGDHDINSILIYQRPVDAATITNRRTPAATTSTSPHVLYLGGDAFYTIHLDGTGLHRIGMQTPCHFLGGLDPTGEHGLCWGDGAVRSFGLDEAAAAWTPRVLVANSYTPFEGLSSPTLAPDGSHFAPLQRVGSGDALPTITIYAVDPSLTTAELVATITLPGMHARRLMWSPDGRWLAFTTDETTAFSVAGATYAFPLAAVLPTVMPTLPTTHQVSPHPPIEAALQRTALVQLEDGIDDTNTWRPATARDSNPTWTYVDDGAIWQVEVRTGQRHLLLTMSDLDGGNYGGICALAWTPDGKQLLFVQCLRAGDFYPPPARLYVYTVPAAEAHP